MLRLLISIHVLTHVTHSVYAFDMWKIIEESNKGELKPNKTGPGGLGPQSDASLLVDGDILRDRAPQHTPTTNKIPVFDWHKRIWRTRVIPYLITGGLTSHKYTTEIEKSLKEISDVSCLSFRRKYSSDNYWLEFYRAGGCFSGVGRRYYVRQSATKISLGNNCVHPSIIVHEVLHALGFYHEQSRYDRDSFVEIHLDRVIDSMESNFRKLDLYEIDTQGTPYDYNSIMHYSNRAFVEATAKGNTIESKFDHNLPLGNERMSPTDIIELNRLYQCEVRSGGWSKWTKWSPCLRNWKKECTKAQVRFCLDVDLRKCDGANDYGVQETVVDCPQTQCDVDETKRDGQWGAWSLFGKCSGQCGWGDTVRTRKCDNPSATAGGKDCQGKNKERRLCRNKRCGGPSGNDQTFDSSSSFGKWTSKGFTLKTTSGWSGGPNKDHTSLLAGSAISYYASAKGQAEFNIRDSKKQLWSPLIHSYSGPKCIMFSYMLNGADLHPKEALTIFIKDTAGNYINLAFRMGGHHGNTWKQAAINFSGMKAKFQIVFEVLFQQFRTSEVALDDIFFDHNSCQKGMEECKDTRTDCQVKAKNGLCNSKDSPTMRQMLGECCVTCNDPKFRDIKKQDTCEDNNKNCDYWARVGECKKSKAWMELNCCLSCKSQSGGLRCTGTESKYANKAKCKEWAEKGECQKNKGWMTGNCCHECKKYGEGLRCTGTESIYANKAKCKEWAESGECQKNKGWMPLNCCHECKKYGGM